MSLQLRFFLLSFVLYLCSSCNPKQRSVQETEFDWDTKHNQILDSLSESNTVIDSLITLCRFAHRDLAHGAPEINCDKISSIGQRFAWNTADWYELILKDSISAFCGCNCEFFQTLVEDYMSRNVVVNGFSIGVPKKDIGHYLSLVVVIQPHQSNMYLFDPMFNGVYTLTNGQVPDLRYLIYLVRKNRLDLFNLHTYNDYSSYLLNSKILKGSDQPAFDISLPHYYETTLNEDIPVKLRAKRTLDHYLSSGFAKTYQEIARYHQGKKLSYTTAEEFKNCLLYVKDVYGPYSEQIKDELQYYLNAPTEELDSIFLKFGMEVEMGQR